MKTETIQTIAKIIEKLEKEPNHVITGNLGSGCHARKFDGDRYKVVIPGDTFDMAKTQLHYLLYDLGVDVGLSINELRTLD